MTETKLNITVEELAAWLAEHRSPMITYNQARRIAARMLAADALLNALKQAEEVLGGNLVWITDQADLGVRQKDPETLRRLAELHNGWKALVASIAEAERGTE